MGCLLLVGLAIILMFDSIQLISARRIRDVSENQATTTNGVNVMNSASPCKCTENVCSCIFMFRGISPAKLEKGTLDMSYDSNTGLSLSLKAGDHEEHVLIKEVFSGVELPPLCVPIPRLPGLRFCAVFYDVRLNQELGLHICASLETRAITSTLGALTFDCLNFSPNNINTEAPDNHRPSFVELHVGKVPQLTFFNSVSLGVLPPFIAPTIIEDSTNAPHSDS